MNKFIRFLFGLSVGLVSLTVCGQVPHQKEMQASVQTNQHSNSQTKDSTNDSTKPQLVLHLPIQSQKLMPLAHAIQADLNSHKLAHYQVKTAVYWHDYQQGLKLGRLGVYLAPPHFAAWAIHKHNFLPLVRLNQPLSYVIAANSSDKSLFEINDLANKPICSNKPLNLDYLLINSTFEKLAMSAIPVTVASVTTEMKNKKSHCKAFSVSDHILQEIAREGDSSHIRLAQGPSMRNYVLISHPQVSQQNRMAIKRYFLQKSTKDLLLPIASQFSKDGSWARAQKEDYPKSYLTQLEKYWRKSP